LDCWITDRNIFFNAVHAGLPEGHQIKEAYHENFRMLPLLSTFLLAKMQNWVFSVLFSSSQIFLEDLHFFSSLALQAFHRFQQIASQEYRGR